MHEQEIEDYAKRLDLLRRDYRPVILVVLLLINLKVW